MMREPVGFIHLTIDDGSNCYVSKTPLADFEVETVTEAIKEAARHMTRNFAADDAERGYTWDPEIWKKQHDAKVRRMQQRSA